MRGLTSRPNTMLVLGLAIASVALAARDPVWTDTWVIVGVYVLIALSTLIAVGSPRSSVATLAIGIPPLMA